MRMRGWMCFFFSRLHQSRFAVRSFIFHFMVFIYFINTNLVPKCTSIDLLVHRQFTVYVPTFILWIQRECAFWSVILMLLYRYKWICRRKSSDKRQLAFICVWFMFVAFFMGWDECNNHDFCFAWDSKAERKNFSFSFPRSLTDLD